MQLWTNHCVVVHIYRPINTHLFSTFAHFYRAENIEAARLLVMDFNRRRRSSVFGHIARLTLGTPAHNALHCQVGLSSGRSLGGDWRRRPGRPRARWTDQRRINTGSVPANLWRQTGHSTGPWWSDATVRAGYAMTTTTTTTTLSVEGDERDGVWRGTWPSLADKRLKRGLERLKLLHSIGVGSQAPAAIIGFCGAKRRVLDTKLREIGNYVLL